MLKYIAGIRAEILRKRGLRNLVKGSYKQAGKDLKRALSLSDNTENRFNMGLFYLNRQEYSQAKEIFYAISEEYPDNEMNSMLLFECNMLQENWQEAISIIRKLSEQKPEIRKYQILRTVAEDVIAREKYRRVKILKSEAQEFISEGKSQEALKKYEEAEKFSPADSEILNNIGSIHLKHKDFIRAYTYFENAHKLDPENAKIKRNLVQAKSKLRSTRKKI